MKLDKLKTFLSASGAELLEPTNPYELVRFRTINGVSVIYRGKRGYSFTGEAREAFEKYEAKSVWQILRQKDKELQSLKEKIETRDGAECFFCGCETEVSNNRTVEHLLSIAHGGNNNINNLVFSCHACNQAVGSMSIIEKVKYREALQYPQKKEQK